MPKKTKKPGANRKPHNVRREQYESFADLFARIANEPRQATIGDKQITMTRAEALLRVMVDRAINGNVREITKLLQIMANDPGLTATARPQVVMFIGHALANV